MWDYDTIKMERSRFPNTLELITGKFLRHSPEFYRWRIEDRLKRLDADPTDAALLDDLAVAYDKTGQHDKAIETAVKTERLRPGRYETAANLGTFYIHAGQPAAGLPHVDRALAINPDAHFGREKYQKALIEYVLKRRQGGRPPLPLSGVTVDDVAAAGSLSPFAVSVSGTFAEFLRPPGEYGLSRDGTAVAIKGVLGMMRFANFNSPLLLEALGSLLMEGPGNPKDDAKLLAARAYLKASYEVPDEPTRTAYRRMATGAIAMQTPPGGGDQIALDSVETDFRNELSEAEGWYAEIREREKSWIRDGKNPEAEFDRLYQSDPAVSGMDRWDPPSRNEQYLIALIAVGGLLALVLGGACVWIVVKVWRWHQRQSAPSGAIESKEHDV